MLLKLTLIIIWLAAIIYLHFRTTSETEDNPYKNTLFDRILRFYIFIFGIIVIFYICYYLIMIFSSLHIVYT